MPAIKESGFYLISESDATVVEDGPEPLLLLPVRVAVGDDHLGEEADERHGRILVDPEQRDVDGPDAVGIILHVDGALHEGPDLLVGEVALPTGGCRYQAVHVPVLVGVEPPVGGCGGHCGAYEDGKRLARVAVREHAQPGQRPGGVPGDGGVQAPLAHPLQVAAEPLEFPHRGNGTRCWYIKQARAHCISPPDAIHYPWLERRSMPW